MGLLMMFVLIIVQLMRITVTSLTLCDVCGSNLLMYSRSVEHELFYVNRVVADKRSFCGAFKSYNAIGSFTGFEKEKCEGVYMKICNLDALPDMHSDMPRKMRRKTLLEAENRESGTGHMGQKGHPRVDKHNSDSSVSPRMISMGIPALFIFCSCLLCPCFRSRKKDVSEAVLTKDSSSMDSMPSTELHHPSEFPGSPARMPGSPFRTPATHLRVPPSPSRFSLSPQLSRAGSVHLNMSQVIKATQNFSPSLKIGEGGFGDVYRAQLQDGKIVAVKRAKKELINSLQSEFSSEVELLAKIEHRNLVRLLGYVDKGNERIIITEHVPNGTLREHLDGMHGKILDFNQRLEICIDVAHALTYLHLYAEKQIIHRDVKSSNILLTESFRAKVADFGFARLGTSEGDDQTHILTKVKGTVGYLDPEYMRTYQLTPKSDVFSFGILMTEILTGRRPVESRRGIQERITIKWAFNSYNEGNVAGLLDPLMNETVDVEILSKMFSLAFQCAAPTRNDRPNMKEVGEQLWVIRMDYLRSVRKM